MVQYMNRYRWSFVVATTALLLAGCGDDSAARVPVSGKILIDGKPLTRGFVQVIPSDERSASAEIGPDGSFQLTTYTEQDGCVLGTHKVAVISNESQGPSAMKWFAPKKYADPATSGLTLQVDEARDDVEINLTWEGKAPFVETFGNEGTMPQPE